MQPTPNGRLHIGHASGPYLRADVLARQLRRDGYDVGMISGSDVYENWILLDAVRTGREPAEVCQGFHDQIGADLTNLGIGLDAWVNPLDPAHAADYLAVHEALIEQLSADGQARLVAERVPQSADTGRFVMGVWLLGRCPNCGMDVGGNACEECGYHFQPQEVVDPRSRLDDGPLAWTERKSWFLVPRTPDEIAQAVARCATAPRFVAVAARYIEQTRGRIRLSQPGEWGLRSALVEADAVLANTFYAFSLYCGQVYGRLRGQPAANPFAADSDVTTIAFFGVDNAIAGIVGPHAMARAHGGLRAFDNVVVNEFLSLEGAKCSTSRHHGIWISELIENTSVSADELRHHLAHFPLDERPADFRIAGFVDGVNAVREWRRGTLAPAFHEAGTGIHGEVLRELHRALQRQRSALRPAGMSLPDAVATVDEWLADWRPASRGRAETTTWLLGVALLAEPFMPALAGDVWRRLGLAGTPALAALRDCRPVPDVRRAPDVAPPLSDREIRPFVRLADNA
jgi:methionyl-tRNA synthetase